MYLYISLGADDGKKTKMSCGKLKIFPHAHCSLMFCVYNVKDVLQAQKKKNKQNKNLIYSYNTLPKSVATKLTSSFLVGGIILNSKSQFNIPYANLES